MANSKCVLLALLASCGDATAWLRYGNVSCDPANPRSGLRSNMTSTLEACKRGCASDGFGHFASWDSSTGHCMTFGRCEDPVCDTSYATYHALKGDSWDKMGCAVEPPTPAPPTPVPPEPAPGVIQPCFDASCRHWNDTDGNRIESHAAGMLEAPDGRWYWYGESKKTKHNNDHGVNCYSAPDISGPWKNEGKVLHQSDIHLEGDSGPYIVERPKVLYNTKTATYVMWFHLDKGGYKFGHAGVATAKQPQGPFTFVHALLPDGEISYDMSLFRDPQDGQAYFVRSVNNKYTAISRLTPDYLNSTGMISNHSVFEGMALFRHPNGTYYIIGSHLTGWNPNPLMLFRAAGDTLDDPQWVNMGNPTGDAKSFHSQPTYVVQYTPQKGDPYFVYMADNWVNADASKMSDDRLLNAAYIWLPLVFKEHSIELHRQQVWSLETPFPVCPTAGTRVFLAACGRDGQSWELGSDGQVALAGSSMCLMINDAAQIMLGDCSSASAFEWTGEQLRAKDARQLRAVKTSQLTSRCADVSLCGNNTKICAGEYVNVAACDNSHGNQAFELVQAPDATVFRSTIYDVSTGDRISKCLTACV